MENEKKRNTKKSSIPSANRKRELGTRAKNTTGTRPKVPITTEPPAAASRKPQTGAGGGNRRSVQTRKPGNSPVKRMIIGLVALVLFAALLIGGWMVFYNMNLQPVGTNTENVVVDIPDGSTIDEIAQILHDKNLIRNTLVFESYAGRHSRGSKQIQAANYEFNQAMSVPQIFNKMLNGEAYTGAVAITLPEGRNIKEMAEILEKNHVCTAADFIAETKKVTEYKAKYPILGSIPDGKDRTLEGYLFADTYNWGTGTEPSVIVTNMLDRFVDVYNASMEQRTQEMGKTVDEIVIMGSIVELETKLAEDKANCASVFYNRIAAGMPLQSDITVDYALGTKNAVLTEAQTQVDSPYNTYKNLGLPVGPICSPSKSSLEAALYPATTTYLFFVADMDSGKLYFNETLEGHNADVQKYMGD